MEVKKHEIMHQLAGIREQLSALQKDFEKEYGTFDVDIQTCKINYPNNGEVNKKD